MYFEFACFCSHKFQRDWKLMDFSFNTYWFFSELPSVQTHVLWLGDSLNPIQNFKWAPSLFRNTLGWKILLLLQTRHTRIQHIFDTLITVPSLSHWWWSQGRLLCLNTPVCCETMWSLFHTGGNSCIQTASIHYGMFLRKHITHIMEYARNQTVRELYEIKDISNACQTGMFKELVNYQFNK